MLRRSIFIHSIAVYRYRYIYLVYLSSISSLLLRIKTILIKILYCEANLSNIYLSTNCHVRNNENHTYIFQPHQTKIKSSVRVLRGIC